MSTIQKDLTDALKSFLDTFQAANTDKLVRTFRNQPPSLNTDLPCGWVDVAGFRARMTTGLRLIDSIDASFVFRDRLTDNGETTVAFDTLVDAFFDFITADARATPIPGAVFSGVEVTREYEETPGGQVLAGARFRLLDFSYGDGRT